MNRTTKTFRPGFESLESRDCMSATLANGVLSVVATNFIDDVAITLNDEANTITVVENGVTRNFASSDVVNVVVTLKASNDDFAFRLAGNQGITRPKNFLFDLGVASDTALIDLANNDNGIATISANVNLTVLGDIGFEDIEVRLGRVENANVNLTLNSGNQADATSVEFLGNLVDASVAVSFPASNGATNFNDGRDTIRVEANGIKINSDSILNVTMNGGQDRDTLDVIYSGELDGLLKVRMDGGRDKDTVRANLALDNESDGTLDAIIRGGASNNDIVALLLDDDSNGEANILNAQPLQD
jgi:hypothetical protein